MSYHHRDLAEQVYQAIVTFTAHIHNPSLQTALAIGGDDKASGGIERRLKTGGVDILVGTIGKLTGLINSKALDLSHIRFFVLDEADQLLSADSLDR